MRICPICKTDKNGTGGCYCDLDTFRPKNVLIPESIYNKLIYNIHLNNDDIKELRNINTKR